MTVAAVSSEQTWTKASADLKGMPANLEAEQAVLGALIFENETFHRLDGLESRHFYEPFHQRIFGPLAELIASGASAEPVVLAERLKNDPAFDQMGGLRYLADLVDRAPPFSDGHVRVIIELYQRRELIRLAAELISRAKSTEPAFDVLAAAEKGIGALLTDAAPSTVSMVDARSSARATLDQIEEEALKGKPKGVLTGLRCFDRRLRGLRPGKLVVLAGRPSMGKTALARAGALGCARRNPGSTVAFFALEMDRRELDERTLSQISHETKFGIPYLEMDGDTLPPEDRDRLRELLRFVPENFIIDDTSRLSVEYVRRRIMALRKQAPVAAAFIDYLQIMDRPEARGRNDAAVLGEMTKALKQIARDAGCAIVLLSQLSRDVEKRDDKRPHLADLRESGAIEQDADAVLFAYREFYYLERSEPRDAAKKADWEIACEETRRQLDVICAKQRRGAIGTDRQVYFAEYDNVEDSRGAE